MNIRKRNFKIFNIFATIVKIFNQIINISKKIIYFISCNLINKVNCLCNLITNIEIAEIVKDKLNMLKIATRIPK